MNHNFKDITGKRFGRLIAIRPTKKRYGSGGIIWECICDCGKQCFVRSDSLGGKRTKSCGCLAKDLLKKRRTKHGMTETSIYSIWCDMLARCNNPNNSGYKYYGGRGIKVCERWHTFENFYEDVGNPPEGLTLDRWPDNDGNYEPSNFRWASRQEQSNNQRPKSCGPQKQRWFFAYNESIGEWDEDNNQHAFARKLNLDVSHISACLHGKQKTHKNWIFQWLPT